MSSSRAGSPTSSLRPRPRPEPFRRRRGPLDTKDIPGFVGANDGAGGTAVLVQLARTLEPRSIGPSVVLFALDGEEAPTSVSDAQFLQYGVRGEGSRRRSTRRRRRWSCSTSSRTRPDRPPRGLSDRRSGSVYAVLPPASAWVLSSRTDEQPESEARPPVRRASRTVDRPDRFRLPCACRRRTCDNLSAVSMPSAGRGGRDDGRVAALALNITRRVLRA